MALETERSLPNPSDVHAANGAVPWRALGTAVSRCDGESECVRSREFSRGDEPICVGISPGYNPELRRLLFRRTRYVLLDERVQI